LTISLALTKVATSGRSVLRRSSNYAKSTEKKERIEKQRKGKLRLRIKRCFAKRFSGEHRSVAASLFSFSPGFLQLGVCLSRARASARLYQDKHTPNRQLPLKVALTESQLHVRVFKRKIFFVKNYCIKNNVVI